MIAVFEFPPSAGCNTLVSLESLYGTWIPEPGPATPPVAALLSLLITVPSTNNDLLMAVPSFCRCPSAPVLPRRSLPARSTNISSLSVPLSPSLPLSPSEDLDTRILKIACDLELRAFILVSPTRRCASPLSNSPIASSAPFTTTSCSPCTTIPPSCLLPIPSASPRRSPSANRSRISSL